MARSHAVLGSAVAPGLWVRWMRQIQAEQAVEWRQDVILDGLPADLDARRKVLDELLGGPGAADLRDALVVALESLYVGTPVHLVRARLLKVLTSDVVDSSTTDEAAA